MADEQCSHEAIENGELEPVREKFSTPFPGVYLNNPERRQTVPALRAFIDYLRKSRRG
jgi:DNA-binding transcriptional LysR family regulator